VKNLEPRVTGRGNLENCPSEEKQAPSSGRRELSELQDLTMRTGLLMEKTLTFFWNAYRKEKSPKPQPKRERNARVLDHPTAQILHEGVDKE